MTISAQAPHVEPVNWGGDRMNELETLMWRSEQHPRQSSTMCMLMLLDSAPEWSRLRAAHEWAIRRVPRLRERVADPALPVGTPAWVEDERFDLDHHLRRITLPAPGGQQQLLLAAQEAALVPLDRSRPLWEGTLIEGLADGRAAYLVKVHHSLTDGLGAVQLLELLQKHGGRSSAAPLPSETAPARATGGRAPVHDQIIEQLQQVTSGAVRLVTGSAQALTSPGTTLATGIRFLGSMRRTYGGPPGGKSPLFEGRTGRSWRFGVLECRLSDLRAAAKAAGGSVNDAFLAGLLGGLRRYHDLHGIPLQRLPMAVPVSLRKADDPLGGNKFAGALLPAPVDIADPAERIAAVRGLVLAARVEPALETQTVFARAMNLLPAEVGAFATRVGVAADVSASNVPGLVHETYLAGAKVERTYPFGPLPGVALMATMVTHCGTCCIGLNMDGSVITDPDVLVACLNDGLAEVLALAPRPAAGATQ